MMNGDICNNYLDSTESYSNGYCNGSNGNGYATIVASSSAIHSSPLNSNCSPSSSSSCSGLNYIEHRVSKMDTLAGVAIKYGVEVADIRRMNGLVTDLQMFALEILRIPLPGRHPPSPVVPNGMSNNGEYQTPPRRPHSDVLDSLQSLKLKPPRSVSPAMSTLQGYYNLKTPSKPKKSQFIGETEMSTYRTQRVLCLDDIKDSSFSESALSKHRKSRSLVSLENAQENGDANENENSVRRRQKCDNNFMDSSTPEILIKDESNERGFFGRIGKGLALRPKLGRNDLDATSKQNTSSSIGDFFNDVFVAMRKSSSTSNLQESENGSSFAWPTSKWSLKADVISRPIFDGLPKPISAKRNKAAMD